MKSSSIITVITYVMASCGLVSASLVQEVGSIFLIAATAVVVLSLAVKSRPAGLKSIWNIAAITLFLYFALDYLLFSHNLMGSAARFLTILAAIKLFDLQASRDYLVFYSLIFFQIIAAAASTISPVFLLIISVFIICAIWAMIVFNIKGEFESRYPGKKELPPNLFPPAFFLVTVLLTVSSIIITLALFFIIPRVGIGLMDNKNLSGLKVSGFSEKIRLGDFGPVKKDTAIVMRVEIPGGVPPGLVLYFRGQTLDRYEPFSWEATTRKKRRIWKKSDDRFVLGHVKEAGSSMVVQKIMLEPLETDVIFGASRVMMVEGRFPTLWTNESGGVYLPNIPHTRIEYTAVSSVNTRISEDIDPEIDYLSTGGLSSKTIKLAEDITRGSVSKSEKARRIEEYLKTNYSYTLSPEKGEGTSPLDDFLFSTKEGYCEHFATAFAMLLRSAGVPARIVTGFLHGEWNAYGNYLLVRQQDAHSWVEADIDGYWTRFDATPSAGLTGLTRTSTFSMYLDSLRFKWRRYIIKYSFSDQLRAARSIESRTNRMGNGLREFFASVKEVLSGRERISLKSIVRGSAFKVTALILLIIAAMLFIKLGKRRKESADRRKTPRFYCRMEAALKKTGVERLHSETAMDFAIRSGNENVRKITEAFERVRYGHRELSNKEREKVEAELKDLKLIRRGSQI